MASTLGSAGSLQCDQVPARDGCDVAAAGAGWVNSPAWPASNVLVAELTVKPSHGAIDSMHGVALGHADDAADLVAGFRLAPDGMIVARDGDIERADLALPYVATEAYKVRIIADMPSQTYSVQVWHRDRPYELARGYKFRTAAARLDTFASVVASPAGSVDLCETTASAPEIPYQRPGLHSVALLPGDHAVISDGERTTRVGSRGEIQASATRGGELAVDAAGNIYIARAEGATLTIDSLSPAFALRWSRTYAVPAGAKPSAAAVTTAGDITFVLSREGRPAALHQITADGEPRWSRAITAAAAAPNAAGYVLARVEPRTHVTVEQYDRDGVRQWFRTWPVDVTVDAIAASAGQIVFGGAYYSTIDFGGATFEVHEPGEYGPQNAYVVALSATGEHVWSQRLSKSVIGAIATNGTQTVVAGEHDIGAILTTRYTLDQTGTIVAWGEGLAGLGWFGHTFDLALGDSGRVYWSHGSTWPDYFTEWPQLVVY